jgi:hypothetical protein
MKETDHDMLPIISLKEEVNHLRNVLQIDGRLRRERKDGVLLREVVSVKRFGELKYEGQESVKSCV